MKVQFSVDARKYFEAEADRLDQVRGDDVVYVTIDFENRTADFVWCGLNDNPANFPAEEDDFDAVVELWEELGFPNELAEWFEIRSPFRDVRLIRSQRTGELVGLSHDAWDGEEYDGIVYTDEYTPTSLHVRIRPITVEYRPDEYVIIDYTDR
ncbi:Uncharacterised protein [[Flavobacterium] thermophilum]|nr:Uncharacterised protein [[Flavobacterium] thermophilum]